MKRFQLLMQKALQQIIFENRILLLENCKSPIRPGDPQAIVSTVPDVQLDHRPGTGRRRRLRFTLNRQVISVVVRTRPLQIDPEDPRYRVQWALDSRDLLVAVSWLERDARVLHSLVDLESIEFDEPEEALEGTALIVETVLGRPIQSLLRSKTAPEIGSQVEEKVRTLLSHSNDEATEILALERRRLERIPHELLPLDLPRRLMLLGRHLRLKNVRHPKIPPMTPGQVQHEVARLTKLVASRACASLRFGDHEITGVLNPRVLSNGRRYLGGRFCLHLMRCRGMTILQVAGIRRSPGEGMMCLNPGREFFEAFEAQNDLYGCIDSVLNYVETNRENVLTLQELQETYTGFDFSA